MPARSREFNDRDLKSPDLARVRSEGVDPTARRAGSFASEDTGTLFDAFRSFTGTGGGESFASPAVKLSFDSK
jgi:hypothetical protein